jgi:hypothetical protein
MTSKRKHIHEGHIGDIGRLVRVESGVLRCRPLAAVAALSAPCVSSDLWCFRAGWAQAGARPPPALTGLHGFYSEVAAFGVQSYAKPVRDGFGWGSRWPGFVAVIDELNAAAL